jgi:hypothetical protein
LEVGVHACNACIGEIDAVDEGEGVDYGEGGEEPDVDFADDAAGFCIFAFGGDGDRGGGVDDILDVEGIVTENVGFGIEGDLWVSGCGMVVRVWDTHMLFVVGF